MMVRTTVIAEAGVNHNGNMDLAYKLIDAAADAGADIVKFQTFKADKIVTKDAPKARYQQDTTLSSQTQYAMLKALELSDQNYLDLFEHCNTRNIEFLSTPFDSESLDFLADVVGVKRIKVSSGDITNAPLLFDIAKKNLPIILSTGMTNLEEVKLALSVLACAYQGENPTYEKLLSKKDSLNDVADLKKHVSILHCTTEYPAPVDSINLLAMETLKTEFGLNTGYSDHSDGIDIPVFAVIKGATVIEKHITLDNDMEGPDHKASIMPNDFKKMIEDIRRAELILGTKEKTPSAVELKNMDVARKSIVVREDIKANATLLESSLDIKRPGNGASPFLFWDLIGKRITRDYHADELLIQNDVY